MATVILVILVNRVIIAFFFVSAVRNILMHSVSKIQRFLMLQLTVHCSKHSAFKGLVTIKLPGGMCLTCHACMYSRYPPAV